MKRKLKALGLALVAVIAISAMAASAAQAETADFSAAEYTAHVDGVTDGITTMTVGSLELTCGVKGTGELQEEGTELTTTNIEFHTCHVVVLGVTFPITVDMNGCDYLFTAGTYLPNATAGKGASEGTFHIRCPKKAGGSTPEEQTHITITIFKSGSTAHLASELRCDIDFAEQTPTEGVVDYFNETTEGKMAITAQFTNIKVKTTKTASPLCPETVEETSTFNGSFWLKATKPTGTYIDTTVTGTP
jgi:hypothetical protein